MKNWHSSGVSTKSLGIIMQPRASANDLPSLITTKTFRPAADTPLVAFWARNESPPNSKKIS